MYSERFKSYRDIIFNLKFFAYEAVILSIVLFAVILLISQNNSDRFNSRIVASFDYTGVCRGASTLCENFRLRDNVSILSRSLTYRPSRDEYGQIASELVRNALSQSNIESDHEYYLSDIEIATGVLEEFVYIEAVSPNAELSRVLTQNAYDVLLARSEQYASNFDRFRDEMFNALNCADETVNSDGSTLLCAELALTYTSDNFLETGALHIVHSNDEVLSNPVWFDIVTSLLVTVFVLAMWLFFRLSRSPHFYSKDQIRNIAASYAAGEIGIGSAPSIKLFSTEHFLDFCKKQRVNGGANILIVGHDSEILEKVGSNINVTITKFFGPAVSTEIFDKSETIAKISGDPVSLAETKRVSGPKFSVYTVYDRSDAPAVELLVKSFDAVILGVDWKKISCLDFPNQLALFNSSDVPTFVFIA